MKNIENDLPQSVITKASDQMSSADADVKVFGVASAGKYPPSTLRTNDLSSQQQETNARRLHKHQLNEAPSIGVDNAIAQFKCHDLFY